MQINPYVRIALDHIGSKVLVEGKTKVQSQCWKECRVKPEQK